MSRFVSLLLCVVLGYLASQVEGQSAYVQCPNNGVNCKICRHADSVNDLAGMPHVNRKLITVSNDYGYYNLFTCPNNPTTFSSCDFNEPKTPDSPNVFESAVADTRDPTNYVDSLAMYGVVAIVMCVFSFLCGLFICIGRYCCCCIRGGTCGKRWPTRKTCWLGFEPNKTTKDMEYSFRGRWAARAYMGVFIFCIILFICLGQFRGNMGFNKAMKSFVEAPQGFSNLVQAQATPVINFAQNVIGTTLVQGIRDINGTINNAVSLERVAANADCVLNKILNLPTVDTLNGLLDTTIIKVNNISATIQGEINTELLGFIAQKNLVVGEINNLKGIVRSVNATLQGILRNASTGLQQTSTINGIFGNLSSEINNILEELSKLEFLAGPAETNSAIGTGDFTGFVDTLIQLRNGVPSVFTPANGAALNVKLRNLNTTSYSKLPDFTVTAQRMRNFNSLLDRIQTDHLIDETNRAVNATLIGVRNAINVDAIINDTLSRAINFARHFDFSGVVAIVDNANKTLAQFGQDSISALRAQGSKITSLRDVLPCLQDILSSIDRFNETIVSLPSDLNQVRSYLDEFNNTLQDAIDNIDQYIEDGLDQYTDAVDAIDFNAIKSQIAGMQTQVNNAVGQLDVTQIIQQVHNLTNININTDIANQLTNANASLSEHRISNGSIYQVNQLGYYVNQLKLNLNIMVYDLDVYVARASNAFTCVQPTGACAMDTDCATGLRRCIHDSGRIDTLIAAMGASTNASTPFVDSVITTLETINSTIQIALADVANSFSSALNQLNSVDTGAFVSEIDSLTQGVLNFDPNATLSQFNDIYQTIATLDFSSARSQIQSLNDTFKQVNDYLDRIRTFRNSTERVKTFLYVTLPGYLDQLTVPVLRFQEQTYGVSGMVVHITQIADAIIAFVNHTASPYVDFGYNLTDKITDKAELFNAFTTDYPQRYGPIQYFVYLADLFERKLSSSSTGMDQFVMPGDPREVDGRALTDGDGHDYELAGKKQYCLTRNCLYNTADFFTRKPVSETTSGKLSLNLTPEQVAGLPYLIPFFICVFGALAVILGLCLKGSAGTSWASCCASITACFIFCQLPGIFLFSGVFFVMPIAMGDFCFGIENVGAQLIHQMGDNICTVASDMAGQSLTGNAAACHFNITSNGYTIPFSVSIPDAYSAVMGACDRFPVDPLRSIYTAAADRARTIPYERLGDVINGTDQPFTIKPAAMSVITSIANHAGDNLHDLILDVSVSVGCENLNGVYSGFKNAFCCDTVGAIYWSIASWYLIGWSMLLCGCGASILGRKRFGDLLWGPESQKHDNMARNQPRPEFDDPEPLAVDDHAPPLEGQTKTVEPVALAPLDTHVSEGNFVAASAEGNTTGEDPNTTSRG